MTIRFSHVIATITLCLLTACGTLHDYTVAKRSDIDQQITAARAATEAQLKILNDQQLALLQATIAAHETREQGAANYLFKGFATYSSLKAMTRPEMVMGQSIQQTAAQLPPATAAAQAKAFEDLKTELDETRISKETLVAQYEAELGKARAEGAAKDKALTDLTASLKHVDEERLAVVAKAKDTEATLSDARKKVDDEALARKQEELVRANDVKAIRIKLSSIVGGLALLCIAGAIWSPLWKEKFGVGAAIFGLVAVGIWWVQPWHVAIAFGIAVIGITLWIVRNHYVESKTAANVYHAIQSIKDTATGDYDRVVKPALTKWMTTYTKDGSTVPDQTAIDHVDKVLMSTGAK